MSTVDAAIATQLKNIEKKTGKSLEELSQLIKASGLAKHGEIRDMLKRDLGLGHGDANTLTHTALKSDGASAAADKGQTPDDVVDELYAGPKAALRPIHDRLMAEIRKFGDFEVSPKKTYVSLRRKKQFAMIGPATKTQVEVGLNMKEVEPTDRLQQLPPKGMCDYKVRLADAAEVDAEMVGWIRRAYDSAG
jgi:predicted transport protein